MPESELLAHWPLARDTNDAAGKRHGTAKNVTFGEGPTAAAHGAANFNGVDSVIEIADDAALRLRNHDFTLAAWVRCNTPMSGVYGDILSKFDAGQRCGVNFWIAGSAPGYNAMSDARHVHFGIDDGYSSPWEDCGRLWHSNPLVPCLVSYKGELYGGLSDADRPQDAAHVFRYASGQKWIDCGRLGDNPDHFSVMSMLVHNDELYCGTGSWDWGRAGEFSAAKPPRGLTRVFRYEGGTSWRDLGQVGNAQRVLCMASFNGELYAGLDRGVDKRGAIFKLAGDKWVECGQFESNDNVETMMPLGGVLYGATHFAIYKYEGGTKWTKIGDRPFDLLQIHSMQVWQGKLVIGTWPQGWVLRYDPENADNANGGWSNMGRLGVPKGLAPTHEINEVNALSVYNGKLYAGVLPKAQVYRYESDGHWTLLGSLSSNPAYDEAICPTWNRVVALTPHKGRLFAATGSSQARTIDLDPAKTNGRVLACQFGQVVDHEHDIGGAWTHLAAAREGRTLRLYVNGVLASESQMPAGQAFDLSNIEPWRIGFGAQGSFNGAIADVRMYRGALRTNEIGRLATP